MSRFGFDQIHLLQSLGEKELGTARVLRMEILQAHPEAAEHVHVHEVDDASILRAVLIAIGSEVETTGEVPFLHFECHGSEAGLILASGEFIDWAELRDILTPINVATRLNLCVSLAACHGQNLATVINPTAPAPVWGLLGPQEEQSTGFLMDFFKGFFSALLSNPDLAQALKAGGGGMPGENRPMVFWPAEFFFAFAFDGYIRQYATGSIVAQRAKRVAAKVQQDNGWPKSARRDIARHARRNLRNHQFWFDRYRARFLMLDQFPENNERFTRDWQHFQQQRTLYGA